MPSKFYTEAEAVKQRAQLNDRGSLYNLEDWIIQEIRPYDKMRILDLGCGTGKQIFAIANHISPSSMILGLDISKQAVVETNKKAKNENLKQLKAVEGSFDNCVDLFQGSTFDLILSSYAVYYAKDMKGLLSGLRSLLNRNGQVFVCGPGHGTNEEMTNIINKVIRKGRDKTKLLEDFIDQPTIVEIGSYYSNFNTVRLHNQIRFDSLDDVLRWWENHISFIPEIYDDVKKEIQYYFNQKKQFTITKNVLGVHYYI